MRASGAVRGRFGRREAYRPLPRRRLQVAAAGVRNCRFDLPGAASLAGSGRKLHVQQKSSRGSGRVCSQERRGGPWRSAAAERPARTLRSRHRCRLLRPVQIDRPAPPLVVTPVPLATMDASRNRSRGVGNERHIRLLTPRRLRELKPVELQLLTRLAVQPDSDVHPADLAAIPTPSQPEFPGLTDPVG